MIYLDNAATAFPKPPEVASPAAAEDASLEELMHWRLAPENPGRLHEAGVTIALTTDGLKKRGDFLKQVRTAVKRGLPAETALAALGALGIEVEELELSVRRYRRWAGVQLQRLTEGADLEVPKHVGNHRL